MSARSCFRRSWTKPPAGFRLCSGHHQPVCHTCSSSIWFVFCKAKLWRLYLFIGHVGESAGWHHLRPKVRIIGPLAFIWSNLVRYEIQMKIPDEIDTFFAVMSGNDVILKFYRSESSFKTSVERHRLLESSPHFCKYINSVSFIVLPGSFFFC